MLCVYADAFIFCQCYIHVSNDLVLSYGKKFKFNFFMFTAIISSYPLFLSIFIFIIQSSEHVSKPFFCLKQIVNLEYPMILY